MRRLIVVFSIVVIIALPVLASCDEEDIDTVAKGGEIIVLTDGSAWQSHDPATSSTWLSADSVLICNDSVMINKDEDGERVGVTKTSYDPDDDDDDDPGAGSWMARARSLIRIESYPSDGRAVDKDKRLEL